MEERIAVTLEEIKVGAYLKGLTPAGTAKVVEVAWFGDQAINVFFADPTGRVGQRLVFRNEEPTLEVVSYGRPWSFDGDGRLLRLASEACRIRLAYLFDPYLAIHTSQVEPLPHQITAVYGEMLARQPLRLLLADDPGAGKTIMADRISFSRFPGSIHSSRRADVPAGTGAVGNHERPRPDPRAGSSDRDRRTGVAALRAGVFCEGPHQPDPGGREVKGRWSGRDDVTLTKNEILCSRNAPEQFRLALAIVAEEGAQAPRYLRGFGFGEPDFAETNRTFSLGQLLEYAGEPG